MDAREQRRLMALRARERTADRPDYPDTPEQIADQEATTEALAPSQIEAMWADEGPEAVAAALAAWEESRRDS